MAKTISIKNYVEDVVRQNSLQEEVYKQRLKSLVCRYLEENFGFSELECAKKIFYKSSSLYIKMESSAARNNLLYRKSELQEYIKRKLQESADFFAELYQKKGVEIVVC